jgi:hypothetical protein
LIGISAPTGDQVQTAYEGFATKAFCYAANSCSTTNVRQFRQLTNSVKIRRKRISSMYQPAGVKTSPTLPIPDRMKAWVLGDPDQLLLRDKPVPIPARP